MVKRTLEVDGAQILDHKGVVYYDWVNDFTVFILGQKVFGSFLFHTWGFLNFGGSAFISHLLPSESCNTFWSDNSFGSLHEYLGLLLVFLINNADFLNSFEKQLAYQVRKLMITLHLLIFGDLFL